MSGRRRVSRDRLDALTHPPIRPAGVLALDDLPPAMLDVVARFDALGSGGLRRLARSLQRADTPAFGATAGAAFEALDGPSRAVFDTILMLTAESYRRRFPGPRPPGRLERGTPRWITAEATSAPELWCLGRLVQPTMPRAAAILAGPWCRAASGRPFAGAISAM